MTIIERITALAQRVAQEFKKVSPDGGTEGQVLTKDQDGNNVWQNLADIDALPDDGQEGQVLTVGTSGDAEWQDPNYLPTGGNQGQVLTKTASGEAWQDIKALPDGGDAGQVLTKTASGEEWQDIPSDIPDGGTKLQVITKEDGDAIGWRDNVTAGQDAPETRTQTELLYLQYGDADTADTVSVHKYVLQAYTFTFDTNDGLYHTTVDKQPYEHVVGVYENNELVLADVAEEETRVHITALKPITGYLMCGFNSVPEGAITLAGQLERIDNLEERPYVISQTINSGNWKIEYSNGYVEQGGWLPINNTQTVTVNLLVPMSAVWNAQVQQNNGLGTQQAAISLPQGTAPYTYMNVTKANTDSAYWWRVAGMKQGA